ncbi:MAG TPA: serine/threonine protein kinase [Pyrinomonadaceae bacterium]|nr:serine/threonine protein kinase [Pyrinomonadaceae bacterium]
MTELKLLQCRLDGRYDIEDCLGRGSYAEIYVARDRAATDERFRTVVVKALNLLLQGDQDPELERTLIQNFQNEATALDRVRHPNIISRLGHGTAIDLTSTAFHYIVLEYLSGGDLSALSRREPLGLDRALFYLQQISAGLAHAHECGVIHRDIKPQNLLLTADYQVVKIADFGVAKLGAADGAITRVGTNIYAAPEHNPLMQTAPLDPGSLASAEPHLTPAADIYSLAKTAYTLICGAPPRRFAQHAITEFPEPIASKSWAASFLRVLERATQTRASDRYQTVQDFGDELNDAAMPPTQPLAFAQPRMRPISDLSLETDVLTQTAPPKPRFETSQELQHQKVAGNGAQRPRLVVPINGAPVIETQDYGTLQQSGRVTVSVPHSPPVRAAVAPAKPQGRARAFITSAILVLAFAGLLAATGAYVRSRISGQSTAAATTTTPVSIVGREALTTTDLNLRGDPSTDNDPVGLAESGSRVRVLNVNSNWCEVLVTQHSRAKDKPDSADQGWVNKKFLKFD